MPQELRTAVADAIGKAATCSVETDRLGRVSAYADLTAVREAEQILPGRLQPACNDDERPTTAFVDAIPGTTIYICPAFFGRPASDMSLTIMHEGLHLAGVHHTDFPGGTSEDSRPMNNAIKRACGYSQ